MPAYSYLVSPIGACFESLMQCFGDDWMTLALKRDDCAPIPVRPPSGSEPPRPSQPSRVGTFFRHRSTTLYIVLRRARSWRIRLCCLGTTLVPPTRQLAVGSVRIHLCCLQADSSLTSSIRVRMLLPEAARSELYRQLPRTVHVGPKSWMTLRL